MAFKTNHTLHHSHALKLSPNLRHSLHILHMPASELLVHIEEELLTNPLLEKNPSSDPGEEDKVQKPELLRKDRDDNLPLEDVVLHENRTSPEAQNALDVAPDVLYGDMGPTQKALLNPPPQNTPKTGVREGLSQHSISEGETPLHAQTTLFDILRHQLSFSDLDPTEKLIAEYLISQTDEKGYFCGKIEETAHELKVSSHKVQHVLEILQTFEPGGVMARDLKECLKIQLQDRDSLSPAMLCLLENLESLAKADFTHLCTLCKVSRADLETMIAQIKNLNPKPGLAYSNGPVSFVQPDIFVHKKSSGAWSVRLNTQCFPHLSINTTYETSVRTDEDKAFLAHSRTKAEELIKSLDLRADTLLKIAHILVHHQSAFLEKGPLFLKPLKLEQVAEATHMHISTISRAVSGKYMATPQGIFEMKYFLASSLSSGENSVSREAVLHKIKALLDAETKGHILSDTDLVAYFRREGFEIARRTITKYRESLGFPSSHIRRRRLQNRP